MSISISIGILAYNESALIGRTLASLVKQSLFALEVSKYNLEIVVVPNGCTDDTATLAHKALTDLIDSTSHPNITWKVCELERGGKSNAWNHYVHELSNPAADYLFLMDADIEFLELETLQSMLELLEKRSEVWVAVDRPIKEIALKPNKTLMEQFSVLVSGLSGGKAVEEGPAWLCGQLYCARADILRRLWLPTRLPTQDAFLYTMVVTNGLLLDQDPERVILAKSASHSFEAYVQLNRLLRHEKWLILGSTVNQLIYDDLLNEGIPEAGCGQLIKRRNQEEPNWINQIVQRHTQEKHWLIPQFILIRRFKSLSYHSFPKAVILFPLATAAFLVDLILSLQANSELRTGSKLGYWGK